MHYKIRERREALDLDGTLTVCATLDQEEKRVKNKEEKACARIATSLYKFEQAIGFAP